MTSKTSHTIKHRDNAKDVFITPVELAKKHINFTNQNLEPKMFQYEDGNYEEVEGRKQDFWYDPFKNSGNYYNNFPEWKAEKDWAEILEGRDFFKYQPGDIDEKFFWTHEPSNLIICSNPPYSMMDKVYERCIELDAKIISFLVAFHSITPRRIEYMEKAGYKIKFLHICKVFKWYGMSCIVIFEKLGEEDPLFHTNVKGLLSYDRKVWRLDEDKKQAKKDIKSGKKK
tara:strand:+ start:149 stop:832 length:684 start_codon:yes stop_codon:yes gene_type:complete